MVGFTEVSGAEGAATLVVTAGPAAGSRLLIPPTGVVVGTEADTPQFRDDPHLSRQHARFGLTPDGHISVEDLGSTNGVRRNGALVSGIVHVEVGDNLKLGSTTLTVMPDTRGGDAQALLDSGRQLFEQRQFDQSERSFRQALADRSAASDACYGLGLVSVARGDTAAAEREFNRTVGLRPDHINASYQLGLIAEGRQDFDRADALYRHVLSLKPTHAGARSRLAVLSRGPESVPIPASLLVAPVSPPPQIPDAQRDTRQLESP